jgi:hypothetical protein
MKRAILIFILFFFESVLAVSGVSPGSYEVNFKPFLEENFTFNFIFEQGVVSKLYVEGDLADYIVLDKMGIIGSEKVIANLKLPERVDSYGLNKIRIGAKQISGGSGGVGIVSDVGGIIKVFVPYPGKSIDIKLNAPNENAGEILNVSLKIINQGNESVLVNPIVQIFKEDEMIGDLNFKSLSIESLMSSEIYGFFNTSGLSSGVYGAVALVDYGGESFARDEDFFKLGELFVNITNYPKEINKTDLAKFDVEVESYWNNRISDLYVKVSLDDKVFVSPVVNLNPWEKRNISVFVDSSEARGRETQVLITLYYNEMTTSKIVSLRLFNSQKNLYFVLFVLLVILILFIIYWGIMRKWG